MTKSIESKAKAVLGIALAAAMLVAPAHAGRVGGPGSDRKVVAAGSFVYYHEMIRGGERTNITLSGDGDSDLDLFVFDAAGNLIVKDEGLSDQAAVWVFTPTTTTIRIEVRNVGRLANLYTLSID